MSAPDLPNEDGVKPLDADELAVKRERHVADCRGSCDSCGFSWPCNTARLLATIRDREREIERLTARVREDNAVCICGCPPEEHESYGEDGESCENDKHECLRACPSIAATVAHLREQLYEANLRNVRKDAALLEAEEKFRYAAPFLRALGRPYLAEQCSEMARKCEEARDPKPHGSPLSASAMPVCSTCNDTHTMWLSGSEREVPCTRCPTPCDVCRNSQAAYCAARPCPCSCHAEARR